MPDNDKKQERFVTRDEFERKLKEREISRWRAIVTLIEDTYKAIKNKEPIPIESIKGLVYSFLLPRIIIIIGSILGVFFVGFQTYIIYQQNELIDEQNELFDKQNELIIFDLISNLEDFYHEEPDTLEYRQIYQHPDSNIVSKQVTWPEPNYGKIRLVGRLADFYNDQLIPALFSLLYDDNPMYAQYGYLSLNEIISNEIGDNDLFENAIFSRGVNFRGNQFLAINFRLSIRQFSFFYCRLSSTTFLNNTSERIHFNHSYLFNNRFVNSNIEYISFRQSDVDNLSILQSDIQFLDIEESHIDITAESLELMRGSFNNASFSELIINRSKISDLEVDNVTFGRTQFNEVEFYKTSFKNINFTDSLDVNKSSFVKSSFDSVDFSGLKNWQSIQSLDSTTFSNISNAPEEFLEFASSKGANIN